MRYNWLHVKNVLMSDYDMAWFPVEARGRADSREG